MSQTNKMTHTPTLQDMLKKFLKEDTVRPHANKTPEIAIS